MARGWESKSVEEQQAEAKSGMTRDKVRLSPDQAARERQRQSLFLSRSRILQQIQNAKSATHRQMLELALADLDAQITRLG